NKAADSHHHDDHHGEGGFAMMLPLIILGIGAFAAGFIPFGHFVSIDGKVLESEFHPAFSIAPVVLGLTGIGIAFYFFKNKSGKPANVAAQLGGLYKAAKNKFYIDELYLFITKKILFNIIGKAAAWFDKKIVDGTVDATGDTTTAISEK